jgi:hypothetical protein
MLLAELEELASPQSPVLARTWSLVCEPGALAPTRAVRERDSGTVA